MKQKLLLIFLLNLLVLLPALQGQPGYTANELVRPYSGSFRAGVNLGIYPPWTDMELADLAAGNDVFEVEGVGAKCLRPALFEHFVDEYGYDLRIPTYEHFDSLGLKENTLLVGFPSSRHRDPTNYCPNVQSEMFANLYQEIWDNGENGTPVNDDNHYALYIYQLIKNYGQYVKFWEIWNEPGFDFTGAKGWLDRGQPGNWWENNPDPCDYKLRAPIFLYIRTLRISYEVIKTLSPEDYVVVSGVGYPSFLDAILRNTDNPTGGGVTADYPLRGGAYFDVLGYHAYPHFDGSLRAWDNNIGGFRYFRHSDAAADGLINTQDQFRAVLKDYGYDNSLYPEKLWMITESNIPRKAFADHIGSDEAQSNFVAKAVVNCIKNDILQLHIYKIGEESSYDDANDPFDVMGLYQDLLGIQPYYAQVADAGMSYKTASEELFGKEYDPSRTSQMNLPSNIGGGAFKSATGEYTYVLWAKTNLDRSESAFASYAFPSNLGFNQLIRREWDYGYTKDEWIEDAQNISLKGSPTYFSEVHFTVSQNKGCTPFKLTVNDQTGILAGTREWTFEGGDPMTSDRESEEVIFQTPGNHEIILRHRDQSGQIFFEEHATVYVEDFPSVFFEDYSSGPMLVLTNGSSGNINSFFWEFGDGTISTEPSPTHVYLTSGTYTVRLTVDNDCGSSSFEKEITVSVPNVYQLPFTANDTIPIYDGQFRPGVNLGVYPGWSDEQLANIAAGNVQEGVEGLGAKCLRPILDEKFLEFWGYDIRLETFQHYANLDLNDNTLMVGFPSAEHRDPNFYCSGHQSELFKNLYLDIWDNGENGTPINEENYYAKYLYETILRYKDFVRFYEIWNEPSFDYSGNGWKSPGMAGNWWDNDPNPCEYKLRALFSIMCEY